MRLIYLWLCIFSFKVSSEVCEFNAKVYPIEYQSETKDIYKEVCNWFYETFNQLPILVLDKVHYVTSWDEVEVVHKQKKDNLMLHNLVLKGIFCCPEEKNKNEIYINTSYFSTEFPIRNQSSLAHELIHFLVKSANFKRLMKSGAVQNKSMYEAFAFWGQNKFIERHSHFNLMDFVDQKKISCKTGSAFGVTSGFFYNGMQVLFLCHATHFFDDHTEDRYNRLIDNKFSNVIVEFQSGFKR